MSTPPLPSGLDDLPVNGAANRLHSAAIHLLRHARVADSDTGLTPERLSLMSVLVYSGPQTITALARIEMVSVPAITRTVNALAADGFAQRSPSRSDRRSVVVTATARGLRIMEKGRRGRLSRIAALLDQLSPNEMQQVNRASHILEQLLDRQA